MAPYQLVQDFLDNPRRVVLVESERMVEATATLVRRVPDFTTSIKAKSTCTGSAQQCQLPTDGNGGYTNLIIALGIAIPLSVAAILFYFMWRRSRAREAREDARDKHASLDFGLGEHDRPTNGKSPEMVQDEKFPHFNRSRGMSLEDMVNAPYALANSLHDSRGSIHSLSRLSDTHDPYRPVQMLRNSSQMSLHGSRPPTYSSRPASGRDTASIWTSASGSTAASAKKSLLMNAATPSRTASPASGPNTASSSASNSPPNPSPIEIPETAFIAPRKPISPVNGLSLPPNHQRLVREGSDAQGAFVPRNSVTTSPPIASPPAAPAPAPLQAPLQAQPAPQIQAPVASIVERVLAAPVVAPVVAPQPPAPRQQPSIPAHQQPIPSIERAEVPQQQRRQSPPTVPTTPGRKLAQAGARQSGRVSSNPVPSSPLDQETYADVLGIAQKESRSPILERHGLPAPMPTVPEAGPVQSGLGIRGIQHDSRKSPSAEDSPDNAEQRANRIRSFYKEYFDGNSSPQQPHHHAHKSSSYSQGYNQEHFYGAPIYDPATGEFYMAGAPYAQPMGRRAMTPPPRAPPKGMRHSPAMSNQGPRPRGYSSASNPRARSQSRGRTPRRIQPPAPLTILPTPGQMKDDSALFSPTDFAPPMSARSRAAGGMSPNGGERVPYSPTQRAFSPLVSSFDDLAFMPSAHALRKSASFTGLDFAPPSRFGAQSSAGTTSDAGSVRSGRSHGTSVSAAQLANIRAGAYRLSRVPKDVVGSKTDMMESLKPRLDMTSRS